MIRVPDDVVIRKAECPKYRNLTVLACSALFPWLRIRRSAVIANTYFEDRSFIKLFAIQNVVSFVGHTLPVLHKTY